MTGKSQSRYTRRFEWPSCAKRRHSERKVKDDSQGDAATTTQQLSDTINEIKKENERKRPLAWQRTASWLLRVLTFASMMFGAMHDRTCTRSRNYPEIWSAIGSYTSLLISSGSSLAVVATTPPEQQIDHDDTLFKSNSHDDKDSIERLVRDKQSGLYVVTPLFLENPKSYTTKMMQDHQRHYQQSSSSPLTSPPSTMLALIIIYSPTCSYSLQVLDRVEQSYQLLLEHFSANNERDSRLPIAYAKMDASKHQTLLHEYSIESFPTLIFATATTASTLDGAHETSLASAETLLLEYSGLQTTAQDIFRATLHYYNRLVLTSGGIEQQSTGTMEGESDEGEVVHVIPKEFESLRHMQDFLTDHAFGRNGPKNITTSPDEQNNETQVTDGLLLLQHSVIPQAIPTGIPETDVLFLRWLLQEETPDWETILLSVRDELEKGTVSDDHPGSDLFAIPDDFVVLAFCRNKENHSELENTFLHLSRAISNRRDRLFATVANCDGSDRDKSTVIVYRVPLTFRGGDWDEPSMMPPPIYFRPKDSNELIEFVVKVATPSTMLLDRQTTAPIAFPLYRKVHAVLFVDTHFITRSGAVSDKDMYMQTQHAFWHFRRACRWHRRRTTDFLNDDMVCLIVPSSETRVLNTFGIDVWGPFDEAVMRYPDVESVETQVLPTILLTDQRRGNSTLRYYLDRIKDYQDIGNFFVNFWNGQLQPEIRTDSRGPRTNSAGVRILTADSLERELFSCDRQSTTDPPQDRHSMIVFVTPTCGHCKRFLVLWNQLSELLTHIGWSKSFLTLYRMDVSTNDLPLTNVTVRWVPDLYYVPPFSCTNSQEVSATEQKLIRYDVKDNLGDDVGSVNDHVEILEWFLFVADLTDERVHELLQHLETFESDS